MRLSPFLARAREHIKEALRRPTLHRDAFFMATGVMSAAVLGFLYWRFAARLYPTAVVGLASAGISSATFLASLASLGLTVGLVRFLPSQPPAGKARLMTFSLLLVTVAAAIVVAVFLAGGRWWASALAQAPSAYQSAFAALTLALVWGNLQTAFLLAERLTPIFTLRSLVLATFQLACILTLPSRHGAVAILWSILLPNLLLALTLLWWNARLAHMPLFAFGFGGLPLGDLMNYSLGSLLFSLIWSLPAFVFPLLTLHRLGAAQNAYLTIAWQIYAFLAIIPNASASAFLIEGSHCEHQVSASLRAAIKNNLLMLPPFLLAIVLLTPFLLGLIAEEYASQASTLLRLLALSALPVSMNSVILTIYRIRKEVIRFNLLAAVVVGISLAFAWLLLGPFGLNGIGWGWLGGQSSFLLASLPLLLKELRAPSLFGGEEAGGGNRP